tara:strand:- start:73 stop:1026 length:954 start_codon:yes stop_codon:yes gene_type:complete
MLKRNQEVANVLKEMGKMRKQQGSEFSTRSYYKAAVIVEKLPHDVSDINDSYEGIGIKIVNVIKEILKTGTHSELKEWKIKRRGKDEIIEEFQQIWSVGEVKAVELYNAGFRSIEELNNSKHDVKTEYLTETQIFCTEVYKDFLKPMTRDDMLHIATRIRSLKCLKGLNMKIVGSYRRGKQSSKDVDIAIYSTKSTRLNRKIVKQLHDSEQIMVLACGIRKLEFALLDTKKEQDGKSKLIWRRVDIFLVAQDELACAMLSFTGPYTLNIEMRQKAKAKGWTLNEKHLLDEDGDIIPTTSEEDVFRLLDMKYLSPKNR